MFVCGAIAPLFYYSCFLESGNYRAFFSFWFEQQAKEK